MTAVNFSRQVRGPIIFATRCEPAFAKTRTSRLSAAQANGVRYENSVKQALAVLAKPLHAVLERNPWFRFADSIGKASCSPDAILWFDNELALVVEVKYTWVPTAETKLRELYIPVVKFALKPTYVRSLVICKTLTPQSPEPIIHVREALGAASPAVYHWLGQGSLFW